MSLSWFCSRAKRSLARRRCWPIDRALLDVDGPALKLMVSGAIQKVSVLNRQIQHDEHLLETIQASVFDELPANAFASLVPKTSTLAVGCGGAAKDDDDCPMAGSLCSRGMVRSYLKCME